ncbi:hypothetical protein FS749_005646 [Ceratobasidium sp. UAMH 11750]|nr:hypothetical protein FS749_005646 [Ceratobasidium sp. UAMH 11750]
MPSAVPVAPLVCRMASTKAERRRTVMNTTNFDPSLLVDSSSTTTLAPTPPPPSTLVNTTPSKTTPRSVAPRQSAQSVSSTSSNPAVSQSSQKSLEQVLATTSPPGDLQSALVTLLEERNNVVQQNAQLWRIIEKQKASLASASKDLERIRAERERYRRLFEEMTTASGSGSERERRPAGSRVHPTIRTVSQTRAPVSRQQSDDGVHRGSGREAPPQPNGHTKESEGIAPTPSGVGSLADSVQASASSLVDRETMGAQASRPPARSESLPASSNSIDGSSRGPPAASTSNTPESLAPPPSLQLPAEQEQPPATAPPLLQPMPAADPATLGVNATKRSARESRISLPDEARQYIANMPESPLQPPPEAIATFAPVVLAPQQPQLQPPPPPGVLPNVAAVSPMNFDGTFAQRMAPVPAVQQAQPTSNPSPSHPRTAQGSISGFQAPPPPPPLPGSHSRTPVDVFADTDDDFSADGHSSTVYSPAESTSRQGVPMIIRNAPSIPSMNTLVNPSSIQTASLRSSTQDDSASLDSSPVATSPTSPASTPPPHQQQGATQSQAQPPMMTRTQSSQTTTTMSAPRLTPFDMTTAAITVPMSHIRANERGKEVLSFVIEIALDPGAGREGWKIEKLYSDVLALDVKVRQLLGRSALKRIAPLPDAKLFKDNAPSKVDQRKAMLQAYLRTVLQAPWKNAVDVTAFFTSDVISHARAPISHPGYKEGYLTKRGKNFGGWKTRYFVLQSPVLEYYESRGGAHLGSISLAGSQIGRQQRQASRDADDENAYRHAFLIIEGKRGPSGALNRHVLCAESDEERDSWGEVLVRYVVGEYDKPSGETSQSQTQSQISQSQSRASTSSFQEQPRRNRAMSKDEILKGNALPISQLAPDASNAKLFQSAPPPPEPSQPIAIDSAAKQMMGHGQPAQELPLSSSLPSHLDVAMAAAAPGGPGAPGQRSNSELGHYPDMPAPRKPNRASFHPSAVGAPGQSQQYQPAQSQRAPSPDKVKISGPMNGVPIPAGYRFGGKDPDTMPAPVGNDRERKAKSGRFWGFGRTPGEKPPVTAQPAAPVMRAVFGIPLQESLAIAQIANLPAIVFRCIEYLEAKKADQEEGIYRLSGSSAVIKNLKDRFNTGRCELG